MYKFLYIKEILNELISYSLSCMNNRGQYLLGIYCMVVMFYFFYGMKFLVYSKNGVFIVVIIVVLKLNIIFFFLDQGREEEISQLIIYCLQKFEGFDEVYFYFFYIVVRKKNLRIIGQIDRIGIIVRF